VSACLQLPERYLTMVMDILSRHAPTAEVWAFGSRVSGACHEASDLDIVVRNPADPQRETPQLAALRTAFSESNLPIRVDILDWARIPSGFRDEISRAHVVVQSGIQSPLSDNLPGNRNTASAI